MVDPIDLSRVRTRALETRNNKVSINSFAKPPRRGVSFSDFLQSLPRILAGSDFLAVVKAIADARKNKRPVILGLGAHVIECGLSRVLIHMIENGFVTAIAMNGAGAIHDVELALIGETSEDVQAGLRDGSFGMVKETGEFINNALLELRDSPEAGMGHLLGKKLIQTPATNLDYSLLAAAYRCHVPITIHVAIGTDIIHMHPNANGAMIGQSSFNDFRIFTSVVCELSGGVYVNAGSAVLLPEVFLKAFTIAQNLGYNLHDYVTVNIDLNAHYRPSENVIRRPASVGGRGYSLISRHELIIPLLAQALEDYTG